VRTVESPAKMKKFCIDRYKLHQQEMSSKVYQIGCSILESGAAKGKDPLVQQRDHLASEIKNSRRSFVLKKERRDAISLVGETKREEMLIISATSISPERKDAIVLVGEMCGFLPFCPFISLSCRASSNQLESMAILPTSLVS